VIFLGMKADQQIDDKLFYSLHVLLVSPQSRCDCNSRSSQEFEDKCYPIVNKPKPKVEPPPVPEEQPKEGKEGEKETPMESTDSNPAPEQQQQQQQQQPPADPAAADPTSMELD
jgi:hypothetical protein